MWTFRPALTGEDELRAELRAERKARRVDKRAARSASKRQAETILMLAKDRDELRGLLEESEEREAELLREAAEREKELLAMVAKRDNEIEELKVTVSLRDKEMDGLTDIVDRDRQRVEAETAIELARAELAAYHSKGEQRSRHGFLP